MTFSNYTTSFSTFTFSWRNTLLKVLKTSFSLAFSDICICHSFFHNLSVITSCNCLFCKRELYGYRSYTFNEWVLIYDTIIRSYAYAGLMLIGVYSRRRICRRTCGCPWRRWACGTCRGTGQCPTFGCPSTQTRLPWQERQLFLFECGQYNLHATEYNSAIPQNVDGITSFSVKASLRRKLSLLLTWTRSSSWASPSRRRVLRRWSSTSWRGRGNRSRAPSSGPKSACNFSPPLLSKFHSILKEY